MSLNSVQSLVVANDKRIKGEMCKIIIKVYNYEVLYDTDNTFL